MVKKENIKYTWLPEHMIHGTRLYIEDGVMPGNFLKALLANDLARTLRLADHINIISMNHWRDFLLSAPDRAIGSYANVQRWCDLGGLNGIDREGK